MKLLPLFTEATSMMMRLERPIKGVFMNKIFSGECMGKFYQYEAIITTVEVYDEMLFMSGYLKCNASPRKLEDPDNKLIITNDILRDMYGVITQIMEDYFSLRAGRHYVARIEDLEIVPWETDLTRI